MQSTKDRLLGAVARYAKSKKGRLTRREFLRLAGCSDHTLRHYFPGGFPALLQAAKLGHRKHRVGHIPDDVLLAEYHRLALSLKRRPSWYEITRLGKFSTTTYAIRFGRAAEIVERYEAWRKKHAPDAPSVAGPIRRGPIPRPRPPHPAPRPIDDFPAGAPISFRGLLHEPTTEAGVIHLFGILGADLGFAVIGIRAAFPDCLAWALRDGKWERLRIEFELRSTNFHTHNHDPKACDLIVCWEHDWKDCPIQVLPLKDELERLRTRQECA